MTDTVRGAGITTAPTNGAANGEPVVLAERILAAALKAGLTAGSRLPTERQLADDHRVSRTSVRHALAVLEAEGLLTRQVGRGTFLRDRDAPPPADGAGAPLTDISPADVMAVRSLLEPAAMALVVTRATTRDFDEMQRCLTGGDGADSYAEFERWDMAFHRAVIGASHNPLLVHLYSAVEQARHGQLFGELKQRQDSAEQRVSYQCQHHAIVDAARTRDADASAAAMREHLAAVSARLFGHLP